MKKFLSTIICSIMIMFITPSSSVIIPDHGPVTFHGVVVNVVCSGWGVGLSLSPDLSTTNIECHTYCIDYVFFKDGTSIVQNPRICDYSE